MKILTRARAYLTHWLIQKTSFDKRYAVANLFAPSTDALIKAAGKVNSEIPTPSLTHLIYHQETVDEQSALNSIRSFIKSVGTEDEVILADIGGTLPVTILDEFGDYEWFSYVRGKTDIPEKQSYTYGLNAVVPSAKAPHIVVWRTDYVYPPNFLDHYKDAIKEARFISPYSVYIGDKHVDSMFVQNNWEKLINYNDSFWSKHSKDLSLYETQDPALFCIEKSLWLELEGLNHDLWGYGWQFADLNGRVRNALPRNQICFFHTHAPIHQFHDGSLQLQSDEESKKKAQEYEDGVERFSKYLGGEESYFCYRHRWILKPEKPSDS